MNATLPVNEAQRLAALHRTGLLDSAPEVAYDDLTQLAAQVCEVPIALVSLVDGQRQWFKSRVGLDAPETPREFAFCAHAILQPDEIFEVPDALLDPRFAGNPLVTADPLIRFYAGMPVVLPDGQALGTVCVFDRVPRVLNWPQRQALRALARHAATLIEAREMLAARQRAGRGLLRAREKIAAAHAWQRAILDNAAVSIISTDPQGVIQTFNRTAQQMLGYSAQEVLGQATPGLFHDPAEVAQRARELSHELGHAIEPGFEVFVAKARAGTAEEREWTYLRKDGSRLAVRLSVTALFDAAGRIAGFMGIATDIGASKRAEQHRDRLFNYSLDMYCLAGFDGYFKQVNPAWTRTLGWTKDEMTARPYMEFVHPDDRDVTAAAAGRLDEGKLIFTFENRYQCKDGSYKWLSWVAYPVEEENLIFAVARDATERQQAEAALHAARDELKERVRERTAALYASNEALRAEIEQRRQAEGLLQGDQDILRRVASGQPIADTLAALASNIEARTDGALCSILLLDMDGVHLRHGAAPSLPAAYNQTIDGGAIGPLAGSCGTAAYRRKQVIVADIATDPLWADYKDLALSHDLHACWSTPIQSADGRVLGTFAMYYRTPRSPVAGDFATIHRATYLASIAIESKNAEQALLEAKEGLEMKVAQRTAELQAATMQAQSADRLKSAFLATMSHELRTPLNSIIGFTGILLQGLAGPLNDEQQLQLSKVQGSARHLLALINDVLDISKIEAGQLEVDRAPFDLAASVHKVAAIVQALADNKGLALQTDVAAGLRPAIGEARRAEQVLLNLLGNAIKFTEAGTVRLSAAAAPGGGLRVDVADTGLGITPADLAGLFQPFRQIDSRLARNHEGTGLGLSISRRLAQLMGGDVVARSEAGRGSVFSLILASAEEITP